SGMCEAGRVRRHLKRLLWRRDATVLLTGFQAAGTLGRLLADGAAMVRIQGDEVAVRARIRTLDIYSAHADAIGLADWAKARAPVAGHVFLAHGEPEALEGLRERLADEGFAADRLVIPALDDRFAMDRLTATAQASAPRLRPGVAASLDWHNARSRLLLDLNAKLDAL